MPRKQKLYHYIYKTTCQVTGKFYVGMHSTDNLEDGYLGSGKILGYSRKKHGDENHKKEIIEMCPSREALKLREKEIVNETLLADPLNINLKYGGEGGWDHKPGILIQHQNVDTVARTRKSQETKQRRYVDDPTRKARVYAKVSASMIGKPATRGTTGMRFSLPPGTAAGSRNSQFGTCWVTNGTAVKIKAEQLDEYLANGYVRGRKFGVYCQPGQTAMSGT